MKQINLAAELCKIVKRKIDRKQTLFFLGKDKGKTFRITCYYFVKSY